ncbi:MAG: ATP-binding protein [Patescibacteria group bacterium]|nr:ATP-binding protein [Patescibacteria group bacterium]
MYIKRKIEKEIRQLSKEFPIIAILGPRQSGKTTLAKRIFKKYKYVSLEDPDMRNLALEDPRGFLSQYNQKVIIDEIQRSPELFSYLQTHTDKLKDTGSFVITGSQNYLLMENISQSLAGRIGLTTLLPLSIEEIIKDNSKLTLEELMLTGFYPRIYDQNIRPQNFYKAYVNTYIEKDIRLIKNIVDYDSFYKFIKIIAGRTGQILNTLAISNECDISHNTVKEWLNVLETSYITYKLKPFYKNYNKRIIKNSKIYFYDTGLVCYLLGIKNIENLNTHYNKGNIFETFVISDFIKNNFNKGEVRDFYFWRDSQKKEIDLIIDDGTNLKIAEIKSSRTIRDNFFQGLDYWNSLSKNNPKNSYLIYAGESEHRKKDINIMNWRNVCKI